MIGGRSSVRRLVARRLQPQPPDSRWRRYLTPRAAGQLGILGLNRTVPWGGRRVPGSDYEVAAGAGEPGQYAGYVRVAGFPRELF